MATMKMPCAVGGGSSTAQPLVPKLSSTTSDVLYTNNTSGGTQPYYAFDDDDSTFYGNNNGTDWYIGYNFNRSVKLSKIVLKTRSDYDANNKNQLEYLINGTWTRIIGMVFYASNTEYTYYLDSDIECTAFRVRYPSGASYDGFKSIQVYGN